MIVVSDASPIISLSAIGCLEVLRHLYDEVLLPDSVRREIESGGPGAPGVAELRDASWIIARQVDDAVLVRALTGELDSGEAEAIALAVETRADLVLVDERRGRAVARRLGISVIGVVGVLVEAKARGLVPAVAPLLDDLLTRAGFRLSPDVYRRVVQMCGE